MERIVPKSIEEIKELYAKEDIVMIDLKSLPVSFKAEAIKYAIKLDDLKDPLMTMNLINLVKVYNTLEDKYFESEDIYVNSVEELLDLKLELSAELKEFTKRISIYFMSMFKSYNKMVFNSTDEHIELPSLYRSVFCATDFLTLSGIFAKAPEFSSKDLVYIDNAYRYISLLISKGMESLQLMNETFQKYEEQ